jgi:hypothetical protein
MIVGYSPVKTEATVIANTTSNADLVPKERIPAMRIIISAKRKGTVAHNIMLPISDLKKVYNIFSKLRKAVSRH